MAKPLPTLRWLWIALMIVVVVIVAVLLPKASFSNDITALLPADRELGSAVSQMTQSQAGFLQLLHLPDNTLTAALAAIPGVTEQPAANPKSLTNNYIPHSARLLSLQQRQQLSNPDLALRAAIAKIYSPSQILIDLDGDPLGNRQQFLQQLPQAFSGLEPGADGLQTRATPALQFRRYAIEQPLQSMPAVQTALDNYAARRGENAIVSGAPRHIYQATKKATREASLIGGLSLLSIIVLLLWLFGTLRPLFMTSLVIFFGCATGLLGCLLVFTELQVMALVFGASLIGLAVDYAFHSMLSPISNVKALTKNLSLASLSSIICYLCLLIQPIILLQQVALFSALGLLTALLSVLILRPWLNANRPPRPATNLVANSLLNARHLPAYLLPAFALAALILVGISSFGPLQLNNDLATLYSADTALLDDERRFNELTGQKASGKALLFESSDEQALLEQQENFLTAASDNGVTDSGLCAASFSPSLRRQQENASLLAPLYTQSRLQQFATALGLGKKWITQQQQSFDRQKTATEIQLPKALMMLSPVAMKKTANGQPRLIAACLLFNGSLEIAKQFATTSSAATYYDFASRSKKSLNRLSRSITVSLLIGTMVVIAWLALWLGRGSSASKRQIWRQAASMLLVPIAACLTAILVAAWLSNGINVFHLVALFLVFGIGIDYAVFAQATPEQPPESADTQQRTALAISCSGITSILAFGLLALSSNPAVASFGIVIAIGISVAAGLALLVKQGKALKDTSQGNSQGETI